MGIEEIKVRIHTNLGVVANGLAMITYWATGDKESGHVADMLGLGGGGESGIIQVTIL
jgi:hypothetical protein